MSQKIPLFCSINHNTESTKKRKIRTQQLKWRFLVSINRTFDDIISSTNKKKREQSNWIWRRIEFFYFHHGGNSGFPLQIFPIRFDLIFVVYFIMFKVVSCCWCQIALLPYYSLRTRRKVSWGNDFSASLRGESSFLQNPIKKAQLWAFFEPPSSSVELHTFTWTDIPYPSKQYRSFSSKKMSLKIPFSWCCWVYHLKYGSFYFYCTLCVFLDNFSWFFCCLFDVLRERVDFVCWWIEMERSCDLCWVKVFWFSPTIVCLWAFSRLFC